MELIRGTLCCTLYYPSPRVVTIWTAEHGPGRRDLGAGDDPWEVARKLALDYANTFRFDPETIVSFADCRLTLIDERYCQAEATHWVQLPGATSDTIATLVRVTSEDRRIWPCPVADDPAPLIPIVDTLDRSRILWVLLLDRETLKPINLLLQQEKTDE